MKINLFLSTLFGLAITAAANTNYKTVSDPSGFLWYGDTNLRYNNITYQLNGTVILNPTISLKNAGILTFTPNGWYTAELSSQGGSYFLHSNATSAYSYVEYKFTNLAGISLCNYTGYIESGNTAGYGLMSATQGNTHVLEISNYNRNQGDISLSNNTLTSTSAQPINQLYSAVYTGIDSYSYSRIDIKDNQGDVTISNNTTDQQHDGGSELYRAHGGAIYSSGNATLSISSNGGSIYIHDETQWVRKDTGIVTFDNNVVSSAGSHATGGAMTLTGAGLTHQLNSNRSVILSNNRAVSTWSNPDKTTEYVTAGGAIYAPNATMQIDGATLNTDLNDLGRVIIEDNYASMDNGNVRGGAIDAGSLTMNYNMNQVIIRDNYAHSKNTTEAYYARGGALCTTMAYGKHSITKTGGDLETTMGQVTITGNRAISDSVMGEARGGFFYGVSNTKLEISNNAGLVTISGNYVATANTAEGAALGGAIYGDSLIIEGNRDNVVLSRNYEKTGDTYRLRSVYLEGERNSELRLSAEEGKSITFEDSIYANVATVTIGNETSGKGSVTFTGANTEQSLSDIKKTGITEEEIDASRTSYFGATINVKGGALAVIEKAVVEGVGLEVGSSTNGTAATVRLSDGSMVFDGGRLNFYKGTTLAVSGASTFTTGLLQMHDGSTMSFNLSDTNKTTAALNLSGNIYAGNVNMHISLSGAQNTGGTYKLYSGDDNWYDTTKITGIFDIENTKLMGNAAWVDGTLTFTCWEASGDKKVTWSGTSDNNRWDALTGNWKYDDKEVGYTGLNDIYFGDDGSGTVTICGTVEAGSIYVENSAGKDYHWVADSTTGGKLSGTHGLIKSGTGELKIAADVDYTGATEVNEGKLVLKGTAELSGAFTNSAEVEIQGETKLGQYSGSGTTAVSGSGRLLLEQATVAITGGADGQAATLKGNGSTAYSAENAEYEISNATITVSATEDTTLGNKLTNADVVNASAEKMLEITNSGNTLISVSAIGGDIRVSNVSEHELTILAIGDNRTVEFIKPTMLRSSDNAATVSVSEQAAFGENATLNANLEILSGTTLTMDGTVTLGGELTLQSGSTLNGEVYEEMLTLSNIGEYVVLFDKAELLALIDEVNTRIFAADELTEDSQILAATYFSNLEGKNDIYITFESGVNGGEVRLTMGAAIPEPTTATLSLLALAGLATRRRRR